MSWEQYVQIYETKEDIYIQTLKIHNWTRCWEWDWRLLNFKQDIDIKLPLHKSQKSWQKEETEWS